MKPASFDWSKMKSVQKIHRLLYTIGLGPLIGTRTWGGLIGITGTPPLVDDGSVTVPTFGIYNTKGEWIIEGVGVEPDIYVVDDPSLMAKGRDPQLERAVQEVKFVASTSA